MEPSETFEQATVRFVEVFRRITQEIAKVIVGQERLVNDVLTAFFAGGHALLEGVPGIGKTLLVHTLADTIDCKFSRIQFTPDLMPSDIIGTRIVVEEDDGKKHFVFQKGPVFTQVLLADEVNRATPKTQSALLEAMQEATVTVAGDQMELGSPFFVIATQNPLEMEGTYPLPEAQLDRFLFKLRVPNPNLKELVEVARRTTSRQVTKANVCTSAKEVVQSSGTVRDVPIAPHVEEFAATFVVATHPGSEHATDMVSRYVKYGSSPRGLQALILGAKVYALLDGRFHVAEEDIRAVAPASLRHRILLNFEGEADSVEPDQIIDDIQDSLTVGAS